MSYRIFYWCVSHIGKIRKENQDNLLCDNHFLEARKSEAQFQLNGNTQPTGKLRHILLPKSLLRLRSIMTLPQVS